MASKYQKWDQKQNSYAISITQLRNKQNYTPNSNNVLRKKLDENLALMMEEENNYKLQPPTPNYKRDEEKYEKYDKFQKFDKFQRQEKMEKSTRSRDTFNGDVSISEYGNGGIQKRENARKKGFDTRVNNIECINEKISTLLNMVKRDRRTQCKSKSKEKETPKRPDISKKYGQTHIQSFQRISVQKEDSFVTTFEQNSQIKARPSYKDSIEHIQRNTRARGASVFEAPQSPFNPKKDNYRVLRSKYAPNEEDRDYSEPKATKGIDNDYKYEKRYDLQGGFEKRYNLRNEKLQGRHDKRNDMIAQRHQRYSAYAKEDKVIEPDFKKVSTPIDHAKRQRERPSYAQRVKGNETGTKFRQIDQMLRQKRKQRQRGRHRYQELQSKSAIQDIKSNLYQKERKISSQKQQIRYSASGRQQRNSPIGGIKEDERGGKLHFERSYIPVTIDEENTSKESQRVQKINQTTKVIDSAIMKIKNKILQSENHKQRIQQKLTEQREEGEGKFYNNKQNGRKMSPNNKFQIKLHPVENDKKCTVNLAQKLSNQVELDGQMRALRESFERYQDQEKWKQLRTELGRRGVSMNEAQLQELIRISPDEHNPFGTEKTALLLNGIRDLAEMLAAAQGYWRGELHRFEQSRRLKEEGFVVGELDLSKKGYLTIEDLVCFVNLYTGQFYRNRDVAMLYKRFLRLEGNSRKQGIQYSTFMGKISK